MIEKKAIIRSKHGLHARPAKEICVTAVNNPKTNITITDPKTGNQADGRSIMSLLSLAKLPGETVLIKVSGKEEERVIQDIVGIITGYEA